MMINRFDEEELRKRVRAAKPFLPFKLHNFLVPEFVPRGHPIAPVA